jgi:hypothetical protein
MFFQGGSDLNLLADYVSDVKFFNFAGYMGINPYEYARGSTFHYDIKHATIIRGFLLLLLVLFA